MPPTANSQQPEPFNFSVTQHYDYLSGLAAGLQTAVQGDAQSARNEHYIFADTPDKTTDDPHGD